MTDRIRQLTDLLRASGEPMEARFLGLAFKGARTDEIELTLRCAAAAGAIVMVAGEGASRWAVRE